jgi:hypothetical protein
LTERKADATTAADPIAPLFEEIVELWLDLDSQEK